MAITIDDLKKKVEDLEREVTMVKSQILYFEKEEKKKDPKKELPKVEPKSIIVKPKRDMELNIGGYVIGIIGALAVIFAAGWFIKLAIERRWLNESARIINGLIWGFGTIIASWILAKKKFKILPPVVFGTGYAILYIMIFSAYYFYELLSINEAFIYLFGVSIVSTFISKAAKSQFLYIFSLIGAFSAPLLISQGENSYRFLFAYMTVLNLIFLYMSKFFRWKTTAYFIFLFNTVIYSVWAAQSLSESSFFMPFLFITLFFTIFMFRIIFIIQEKKSLHFVEQILFAISILTYIILGHLTTSEFYPNLVSHFYLCTALFLIIWYVYYKQFSDTNQMKIEITSLILIGLIPIFFTCATLFGDGPWIAISAITIAGALSLIGSYSGKHTFTMISIPVWLYALGMIGSYRNYNPHDILIVLNSRFYLYIISSLFMAGAFYFRRKDRHYWIFGFGALLLIIIGSLFENHDLFLNDSHLRRLSYSYIILAYALALIIPGFKFSKSVLRITGLALVGVVIGKFYFYDIWVMNTVIRIIAGFTLGISLILMAVFYQKFKEKVLNKMFSKIALILIITVSCLTAAQAEPVRTKSFQYYKNIVTQKKITNKHVYGIIHLDDAIYKNSYWNDIRVVYKENALPYFMRNEFADEDKRYKRPKVIHRHVSREGRSYILELPKIPKGSEYTDLIIDDRDEGTYEMNIHISKSSDLKSWRTIGSRSIFRYMGHSSTVIRFHLPDSKYIRIETNSTKRINFPRAAYLPAQMQEFTDKIPIENLDRSYNSDKQATVYYYNNEKRKKIHQISLQFKDKRFSRRFEIYTKSNKRYVFFRSGSLWQKKDTVHFIDFITTTQNPIKLLIFDGDNEPLKLTNFAAYGPKEILIFTLPKAEAMNGLRLYYGNRYIKAPAYDITSTFERKNMVRLRTGDHTENQDFSYSVLEPPLSSWIIRILFISGLLGLLWPSYRIIKSYTENLEKEKEISEE